MIDASLGSLAGVDFTSAPLELVIVVSNLAGASKLKVTTFDLT